MVKLHRIGGLWSSHHCEWSLATCKLTPERNVQKSIVSWSSGCSWMLQMKVQCGLQTGLSEVLNMGYPKSFRLSRSIIDPLKIDIMDLPHFQTLPRKTIVLRRYFNVYCQFITIISHKHHQKCFIENREFYVMPHLSLSEFLCIEGFRTRNLVALVALQEKEGGHEAKANAQEDPRWREKPIKESLDP